MTRLVVPHVLYTIKDRVAAVTDMHQRVREGNHVQKKVLCQILTHTILSRACVCTCVN